MNLRNARKAQVYLVAFFLLCFFTQTTQAASNSSGFQPIIDVQLQHEDNVRRAPRHSQQSDSILILKMDLPLRWDFGKHKLDVTYEGEYSQYAKQKALNYNDHELRSRFLLDNSYRLNTEYELGFIREHDIPNDNDVVANLTGKPNRWKEKYVKANLLYGKNASQGQVITKLEYKQRNYTNNNREFLDSNRISLLGAFYYRITSKTRIPFELNIINYDYQNSPLETGLSNNEYRYLTGITWDATAKSTGILQLGLLEKKYDNSLYNNTSIFVVRLNGVWKPNTFTTLMFGVIRDSKESLQAFSPAYIQNQLHAKITHMIRPRTTFFFGARYTNAETKDLAGIKNNSFSAQVKVQYSLLRWLYGSIGYKHIGRDSDFNNLDFKTNIFSLEIQARFND